MQNRTATETLKCRCGQESVKAILFIAVVFIHNIFLNLAGESCPDIVFRARGFQLNTEQMYQQSPNRGISQYANEKQVISTQYSACITRHCGRLAGGKMITLHNESFLLRIAPGETTHIFCETYAVERLSQNVSGSSWKCFPLVTNMNDLWSSLCGKHGIKSCPIWQGEWVCLVPARRFYYFKLFCHLRSCILPGLPVLGSCSQLIKMANAGDQSWIFLSNLAESSWIFKVQPQTCRHLQPTHCLSLIKMVWRCSNSGAYYRKEPCLGIKGRAVSSVTSQTHMYQSGSNMSVRLL